MQGVMQSLWFKPNESFQLFQIIWAQFTPLCLTKSIFAT